MESCDWCDWADSASCTGWDWRTSPVSSGLTGGLRLVLQAESACKSWPGATGGVHQIPTFHRLLWIFKTCEILTHLGPRDDEGLKDSPARMRRAPRLCSLLEHDEQQLLPGAAVRLDVHHHVAVDRLHTSSRNKCAVLDTNSWRTFWKPAIWSRWTDEM